MELLLLLTPSLSLSLSLKMVDIKKRQSFLRVNTLYILKLEISALY